MNFAIDQINDTHVILENTLTGEKIEVIMSELPEGSKEGNIITLKDGKYILNNDEEVIRRYRIQEKLNRLKKLKSRE